MDIPWQRERLKLLVFLAGDEMGNNPKGQINPGICIPDIGRGYDIQCGGCWDLA
ncbi:hypothetical protein [Lelliottia amnigena]|uniref:hypothetical protein n=1 Tax=Lelliottia amnigena TaxID=61646 RepID=UPI0021DA9AC2|nr:hypothetical protein [Lelliottia amnigena]MCU7785292.1 hypothetical protein [Lelliottia amnigena]